MLIDNLIEAFIYKKTEKMIFIYEYNNLICIVYLDQVISDYIDIFSLRKHPCNT